MAPVPPFPIDNVPVTPGLGEAAMTLEAVVEPKFVSKEGLDVKPVPPAATGNVLAVIAPPVPVYNA